MPQKSNIKRSDTAISHDGICKLQIPPREYLLSGVLPVAGMAMVHAMPGVGKTLLAMGMAHAVATGGEFLKWKAPAPRRVLYLDGEMPLPTLGERMHALFPRAPNMRILTPDLMRSQVPDLSTFEGRAFVEAALGTDTDLFVADNLSCLFRTGKENDSESWAAAQHWFITLRSRGITSLIVHHQGKSGSQRGTSKREDVMDTVIALKRPSNYRMKQGARFEVHFTKLRGSYGDVAEPFEVKYSTDEHGRGHWDMSEGLEDPRLKEIRPLLEQGFSISKIARETALPRSTVGWLVRKIREQDNESEEW